MEILEELPADRPPLKIALFDFDGTISTIRQGWEGIYGAADASDDLALDLPQPKLTPGGKGIH